MAKLRIKSGDKVHGCLRLKDDTFVDLVGQTVDELPASVFIKKIIDYGTHELGKDANIFIQRGKEEHILDTLKQVKQYFRNNK